jgi:hypothetical protein
LKFKAESNLCLFSFLTIIKKYVIIYIENNNYKNKKEIK